MRKALFLLVVRTYGRAALCAAWSFNEGATGEPMSATDIVATAHWAARFLSVEKAADEISATGSQKAPLANLCPQRIWARLPTGQLASYPLRKPPMKFLPLAVIGGFPPPRCQKSRADSSTTVQPEKTNRLTSNQFILFLNLNLVLWTA